MRKDKGLKIKVNKRHLVLSTTNWCVLGISWKMPLRLMIMGKVVNRCYYVPKSLLNVLFNIGDIVEHDGKGIQIYLEVLGKGFRYCRYRRHYPDGVKSNHCIERFRWVK